MSRKVASFLFGASLLFGTWLCSACTDPPPATRSDAESCPSTQPGRMCLVLHAFVSDDVRKDAEPGRLEGPLHWGVYRGGDVGLLGPHDGVVELYGGRTDSSVDLSSAESFHDIVVPDVPAGDYQVLAFLGNGDDAVDGDPVTFPSDPFPTIPDRRNVVDVALNYLR